MIMPVITPDHQYFLDGKRLPSVTGILKAVGKIDTTWYTEEARDRGTKVHQAIASYYSGERNEADVVALPFLFHYLAFVEHMQFKCIHSEKVVWCRGQYGLISFAGTFDLYGYVGKDLYLIDVKTGSVPSWVWLQLGGYAEAAAYSMRLRPKYFGCLLLTEKTWKFGTKFHPRQCREDWRGVLREYQYRRPGG